MKNGLLITMIVIAILLIIVIYLQSGKVKNVGSSIVGTKDIELFENQKRRGTELWLHVTTWILVILFMLFAFLLVIL